MPVHVRLLQRQVEKVEIELVMRLACAFLNCLTVRTSNQPRFQIAQSSNRNGDLVASLDRRNWSRL